MEKERREFASNAGMSKGTYETHDDYTDRVNAAQTLDRFNQEESEALSKSMRNTLS